MALFDPKGARAETRQVAGKSVAVLLAPRLVRRGFLHDVFYGLKSLLTGMRVTLPYGLTTSRIVTRQYPENRGTLKMYERYRARLTFIRDGQGRHTCTGCRNCEKACPNGSIIIETAKGAVTGKNEVQRFIWRFDACTFCNLCVYTCPFDALEMKGDFEHAVFDRRLLVYNLNSYAGPHASLWDKVEDEEQRKTLATKISPYDGKVPLAGTSMAGCPARAHGEGGAS
ncbi:MAG: 4Fe-4S binding protein [Deltaproteobacteria bacterium]|nr:4Fe-4S binding protein [Deltaproteobacteria bacterium]